MGDSITAGARVDSKAESYPARLAEALGDTYAVTNLGRGGATLIRKGRPNVWMDLPAVTKPEPHIVVISLGTNDTVVGNRRNWERIDDCEGDYQDLIDRLAALPSRPRIIICTPTDMVLQTPGLDKACAENRRQRRPRLHDLAERIRRLARRNADNNVELLEVLPVLQKHPELLTEKDGVHPIAEGYLKIAQTVAEEIRRAVNVNSDGESIGQKLANGDITVRRTVRPYAQWRSVSSALRGQSDDTDQCSFAPYGASFEHRYAALTLN